eukprot:IDg3750t1
MTLHSLCTLGQIEGASTVEQTTDETVKSWFDQRLKSKPRDLAERTSDEKGSLTYFQDRVASIAVDVAQGEISRERLKRKRTNHEIKKLLDEYYQKKKAEKSVKKLALAKPCDEEGRYAIKLEDSVSSIALGDTGSDVNAMTSRLLDEVLQAVPTSPTQIHSKLFKFFKQYGFKLHAEESCLFTRNVMFCVRVLTLDGVQCDPRHFNSLLEMNKPVFGDQLQQLICATKWMHNSIPACAQIIAPLHNYMESFYKKAAAAKKLSNPKKGDEMCLFTDASETHWGLILTQRPFKAWSTPEKEGFAIVESMCRLDYLVSSYVIPIYTDYANLVYIYDQYGRNTGMPRHTANKLMRWAL